MKSSIDFAQHVKEGARKEDKAVESSRKPKSSFLIIYSSKKSAKEDVS